MHLKETKTNQNLKLHKDTEIKTKWEDQEDKEDLEEVEEE